MVLIDRDQASAERGKAYAVEALARQVERGRMTADQRDAILARITPGTDYEGLRDADVVVEAVFEDRAIKAEVTKKLDAVLPETCVLATNTRRCRSRCWRRPASGRSASSACTLSPADRMPLVEVIRGKATSDATLAQALDLSPS